MTLPELPAQGPEYFPLNPGLIEPVIRDIQNGSPSVLLGMEANYLTVGNPELAYIAGAISAVLLRPGVPLDAFGEGALTVHKLAREAGVPDGTLPMLSVLGASQISGKVFDAFYSNPEAERVTVVSGALMPELVCEPTIHAVVKEIADPLQEDRRDFYYAGAATVIAGLRYAKAERSPNTGLAGT